MATTIESSPPPGWDRPAVDHLLDAVPQGQLSEIVGSRSSGATSLLVALLARATAAGRLAAVVDVADTFDPACAAAAGADLRALLWVRCGGHPEAGFRGAELLARCQGFAVIALDLDELGASVPPARWIRLRRAVEDSDTALVVRAPRHLAGSAAALVLAARRAEVCWIGSARPTRLGGLRSDVEMLRSRPSLLPEGAGHGPWALGWQL
jgi:hypothetical protein